MKFILTTLVDITETNIRRGPDRLLVGQQSNYDTLIQVIGLRANPTPIKVKEHKSVITNLGFGSKYKGTHKYWVFEFEVPDGSMNVQTLKEDFDLVPYVNNLTETVNGGITAFMSQDSTVCNVLFSAND